MPGGHSRGAAHPFLVALAAVGLATILAVVSIVVVVGTDEVEDIRDTREHQAELEPFFTPPDPLPPGAPGDVLRSEPLGIDVPNGTGYRILYRTESADGAPRAGSGMVFVPHGRPPAEGRPLVSWAHPTVGMGDACAPSRAKNPLGDMVWLSDMLRNGWVVTATDYAGLGTPGLEEYLVGVSEAHDVLNAVRAAQRLPGSGAGSRYALWGHSQGGHAVLWSALLAPQYAPELQLVAAAAAAPAAELVPLIEQQWRNVVAWVIGIEIAKSWPAEYPSVRLDVLTGTARRHFADMAEDCLEEGGIEALIRRDVFQEEFFAVDPMTVPAWRAAAEAQTPDPLPPGVPLLIAQGLADEVVLPNTTALLIERSCAAGTDLTTMWMGDTDHGKAAAVSGANVTTWLAQRFAGIPPEPTCAVPLPVDPAAAD